LQTGAHLTLSPSWLVQWLAEDAPTLVGIDHGFSFPLRYFENAWALARSPGFLDDFQRHWPTDQDHLYVDFIREGIDGHGNGAARMGIHIVMISIQ
jgi:hypothetical protein